MNTETELWLFGVSLGASALGGMLVAILRIWHGARGTPQLIYDS